MSLLAFKGVIPTVPFSPADGGTSASSALEEIKVLHSA
jgi:hypothetical protein